MASAPLAVTKRDGSRQPLSTHKIYTRLQRLHSGLS